MPDVSASIVLSAWKALWTAESPYHLPSKLKQKTRVGLAWFRPIPPIPVPASGPIVVLNQEPWGAVTINLKNSHVANLGSIRAGEMEFDPATGRITAKVSFGELRFSGDYEVRRGRATATAVKIASQALKQHRAFAAVGSDPNITLAQNYQSQLTQSDSGRFMLDTYYTHNDAYSSAFQNTQLLHNWQTYQTNGKVTADFANQTSTAAQSGNENNVNVNQDPDYAPHSFAMQLMVATTCNHQGNVDAGKASYSFGGVTKGPSQNPQTVLNVMTTVANSQPPTSSELDALAIQPDPVWMDEVRRRVAPIQAAIEREEEDVRRGVILREETARPIHSGFTSIVQSPPLTLTGTVLTAADGSPVVTFTGIEGRVDEVNLTLGIFPGQLHPPLAEAVGKAGFLKAILAKRVTTSLASSGLLPQIGRLMTLALNEKLGPVL